jgi:hypothetical protein
VQLPEAGVCATCDRTWGALDLGQDRNGDPQCADCKSVAADLDDRSEHRAYAYR